MVVVQAVLPKVGRQARVQPDYGIAGHHLAQFSEDPLGLDGISGQASLGLQPLLPAGEPVADFGDPGLVGPVLSGLDPLNDFLQHRLDIALDSHFHWIVAADFLGVDLYLHDASVGGNKPVVVEAGGLAQPGAGGQDHVGVADGLDPFIGPQPAQVPQEIWVVVGYRVGPPVGCDNGSAQQVGQAGNFRRGHAPLDSATGHDHRTLGGKQCAGRFVHQVAVAPGPGLAGAVGVGRHDL